MLDAVVLAEPHTLTLNVFDALSNGDDVTELLIEPHTDVDADAEIDTVRATLRLGCRDALDVALSLRDAEMQELRELVRVSVSVGDGVAFPDAQLDADTDGVSDPDADGLCESLSDGVSDAVAEPDTVVVLDSDALADAHTVRDALPHALRDRDAVEHADTRAVRE